MRVNFFAETKTNIGNLPLSRWKTIKILKIVRFQSLNFISKPKGYLLRPTKLWEKLILLKVARLDFLGWYLPTLSINYVGMSKDMEKRLLQLYYIKMKISYDLGFIAIGVAMAT